MPRLLLDPLVRYSSRLTPNVARAPDKSAEGSLDSQGLRKSVGLFESSDCGRYKANMFLQVYATLTAC